MENWVLAAAKEASASLREPKWLFDARVSAAQMLAERERLPDKKPDGNARESRGAAGKQDVITRAAKPARSGGILIKDVSDCFENEMLERALSAPLPDSSPD